MPRRRGASTIQPIRIVTSTRHTNPMISGQYMAANTTRRRPRKAARVRRRRSNAGVHRDLLAGGRECTSDLEPAVLPEYEPQLARRPQTVGVVGAVRRARARIRHGTEVVLMEEAVLATHLHRPRAQIRHPSSLRKARPRRRPSNRTSPPFCNDDFRKSQEVHSSVNPCKQRDVLRPGGNVAQFP